MNANSDKIGLLGSIYTCASVIVVFHMFALQVWLQMALELDMLAYDIDERTVAGSIERSRATSRLDFHLSSFPVIQVAALGGALLATCGFALVLAIEISDLNKFLTIGPIAVLVSTFVGVTLAIRRLGKLALVRARARLN